MYVRTLTQRGEITLVRLHGGPRSITLDREDQRVRVETDAHEISLAVPKGFNLWMLSSFTQRLGEAAMSSTGLVWSVTDLYDIIDEVVAASRQRVQPETAMGTAEAAMETSMTQIACPTGWIAIRSFPSTIKDREIRSEQDLTAFKMFDKPALQRTLKVGTKDNQVASFETVNRDRAVFSVSVVSEKQVGADGIRFSASADDIVGAAYTSAALGPRIDFADVAFQSCATGW